MAAEYVFLDEWDVDAPPGAGFRRPSWTRAPIRSGGRPCTREVDSDGPPAVGCSSRQKFKANLPYTLSTVSTVVRMGADAFEEYVEDGCSRTGRCSGCPPRCSTAGVPLGTTTWPSRPPWRASSPTRAGPPEPFRPASRSFGARSSSMGGPGQARSRDRSYGRDMALRSTFTVVLAMVLVLTTSAAPRPPRPGMHLRRARGTSP